MKRTKAKKYEEMRLLVRYDSRGKVETIEGFLGHDSKVNEHTLHRKYGLAPAKVMPMRKKVGEFRRVKYVDGWVVISIPKFGCDCWWCKMVGKVWLRKVNR